MKSLYDFLRCRSGIAKRVTELEREGERIMSLISDQTARITALDTKLNTAVAGLREDVTSLKGEIEVLKANGVPAADLQALSDAITSVEQKADALSGLDSETPGTTQPPE
jgi:prefoldin subunit 5